MVSCVVCSKRPDKKSKRSFHVFPFKKRPDNADKWVEWVRHIKNPNWTPSKTSILCSDHFTPSDFNNSTFRVELNGDSVPTITSPSHRTIELQESQSKSALHKVNTPTTPNELCGKKGTSTPDPSTSNNNELPVTKIFSTPEKNLPSEPNDKCDVTPKSSGSSPLEECGAGRRRSLFLHDHNYENTPTACRRQVLELRKNLQKARAINKAQERKIKRLIKRVESLKALVGTLRKGSPVSEDGMEFAQNDIKYSCDLVHDPFIQPGLGYQIV